MPTFDDFWTAYPRKVGKGAALKLWPRACKLASNGRAGAEIIIEALRNQIEAGMFSADKQYQPHPRTWLSQGRWEDEVVSPVHPKSDFASTSSPSDISAWIPKVKARSPFACQWVRNHYAAEAREAFKDGILDDADMRELGL